MLGRKPLEMRKADNNNNNTNNNNKKPDRNRQKKCRIIGTPDYIPPEVIKGNNNLNSSTLDWWSVGVILFEMLVGVPPFNDESVEQIFENILNMKVPWDQITIGKTKTRREKRKKQRKKLTFQFVYSDS